MGGGDLNLKKSWHPNTMKNQERVWKVEQQKALEEKKIAEKKKEIEQERMTEDLQRIAESSGSIKPRKEKLDWMYQGVKGNVNREEYLLGRKIDKSLELIQSEETAEKNEDSKPAYVIEHEVAPECVVRREGGDMQVDIRRKIKEDPLYYIRQEEEKARKKVISNPIKMQTIQLLSNAIAMKKEKKKSKKKKHKKDKDSTSKKHKKKHKKRVEKSSSESSADDEPVREKNSRSDKTNHRNRLGSPNLHNGRQRNIEHNFSPSSKLSQGQPRKKRYPSNSPERKSFKQRSVSPVSRDFRANISPHIRKHSPSHSLRRGKFFSRQSPSPQRQKHRQSALKHQPCGRSRSRSLEHKVYRRQNVSPERSVYRRQNSSPERKPYVNSSPSPQRKAYKSSSPSPQRKTYRKSSASPQRKAYRRSSPSPQGKAYRKSSPSPQRKAYRRSSPSPQRKAYRRSSPSPQRKVYRRSSPSPQRKVYRRSSPSPQRKVYRRSSPSPPRKAYRRSSPSPPRKPYRRSSPSPRKAYKQPSPSPPRKAYKRPSPSLPRKAYRRPSSSPERQPYRRSSSSPDRKAYRRSSPTPPPKAYKPSPSPERKAYRRQKTSVRRKLSESSESPSPRKYNPNRSRSPYHQTGRSPSPQSPYVKRRRYNRSRSRSPADKIHKDQPKYNSERRPKRSEEEMDRLRQQMMVAAKEQEKSRTERIARYRKEEELERLMETNPENFNRNMNGQSFNLSVEDRIKSKAGFSQKGNSHMNKNFARK